MRSQRLTLIIFIGMVLGIAVGYACNKLWPDPQTAKTIAGYISLLTDIFLRLIKMIIAPLVFTTLVVGVAHMGDTKAVGRIGGKAMLWFVSGQSELAAAGRRGRHQPQRRLAVVQGFRGSPRA
jgi:Na+/H+-dicarboxylate symporter